jgi:hypothetical protein
MFTLFTFRPVSLRLKECIGKLNISFGSGTVLYSNRKDRSHAIGLGFERVSVEGGRGVLYI